MANSVNPDPRLLLQEQSDLGLHFFAYAIILDPLVYQILGHLTQ